MENPKKMEILDEKVLIALPLCLSIVVSGCASIVDGGNKPVTISSSVPAAKFEIKNRGGTVVHSGKTPQTVSLSRGAGYFKKERYSVVMNKEGYEESSGVLEPTLSGWYFGNILIGGLIGMLIVDPATGAMYKLPDNFSVPMRKAEGDQLARADSGTASADDETAPSKTAESPVFGKWAYQAQLLVGDSVCTTPSMVESGAGFEVYSTSCNQAPTSIRCEFGSCAVQ